MYNHFYSLGKGVDSVLISCKTQVGYGIFHQIKVQIHGQKGNSIEWTWLQAKRKTAMWKVNAARTRILGEYEGMSEWWIVEHLYALLIESADTGRRQLEITWRCLRLTRHVKYDDGDSRNCCWNTANHSMPWKICWKLACTHRDVPHFLL